MRYDLVVRSRRTVLPDGTRAAAVAVSGPAIAVIEDYGARLDTGRDVDLGDLALLPGLVDTHVHVNEPGRTEWEGFATATRAAAAGGVTTLVDMPLNCVPEITTVQALQKKRAAASGQVWVDWAAWGGVVPGNADDLGAIAASGVAGFKCFLIHSGIDGFQWVDEPNLRDALQRLKGTGLPLLAHAE